MDANKLAVWHGREVVAWGSLWDGSPSRWPEWRVPRRRNAQAAQITYTVRMVEAEGVGWREGVFTRLKPVTRQGAATVWTVPRDATNAAPRTKSRKSPAAQDPSSPEGHRVQRRPRDHPIAATIASSSLRLPGMDEEPAPEAAPEDVRVGWHTTMVGRKLDQGILVQVVFEDTVIRAVHQSRDQPDDTCGLVSTRCDEVRSTAAAIATHLGRAADKCTSRRSAGKVDDRRSSSSTRDRTRKSLGEWLIPRGEVLLVSFGAHTVADKDGKAVVKERLAIDRGRRGCR